MIILYPHSLNKNLTKTPKQIHQKPPKICQKSLGYAKYPFSPLSYPHTYIFSQKNTRPLKILKKSRPLRTRFDYQRLNHKKSRTNRVPIAYQTPISRTQTPKIPKIPAHQTKIYRPFCYHLPYLSYFGTRYLR